MPENKKNATSPDDQLVQDMNNGPLTPDEKAVDTSYQDPLSLLGEDKRLKRTGFGVTKLLKKVDLSIYRFENGGKLNKTTGETVEPLSEEEEDLLETELINLFKLTISPLTKAEVESYGLTEYTILTRAIEMRQSRANGVSPEEFLKNEKKQREMNIRSALAEQEMTIAAMESGNMDFLQELLEFMRNGVPNISQK